MKNRRNRLTSYLREHSLRPQPMEKKAGVAKSKQSPKTSSSKALKPAKPPKPASASLSVPSEALTIETEFSGSAAPMLTWPEFNLLLQSNSSDKSSVDYMALSLNLILIQPEGTPVSESGTRRSPARSVCSPAASLASRATSSPCHMVGFEDRPLAISSVPMASTQASNSPRVDKQTKKHRKRDHHSPASVHPSDPTIKFKGPTTLSVPSLSVATAVAKALILPDPNLMSLTLTKPPTKKHHTEKHQPSVPVVSVPPIPAFSLKFDGRQWSIQSAESTEVGKIPSDFPSTSSEESEQSDLKSKASGSVRLVTLPESEVEERSPPSSSESMRNYTAFLVRMAKTIDLPIHQPKPKRVCHIFGRIASDETALVHLTLIPSFLTMVENSFQSLSATSVSRRLESLYRVHDDKVPYLDKHPAPNSVVVASSQKGRKLDTMGRNLYSYATLLHKINYQGAMGAYQRDLLAHLHPFLELIPESKSAQASALYDEALALAAQQMRTSKHAFDCSSKVLNISITLRLHAWLCTMVLSDYHKAQIEALSFDGTGLFHTSTDNLMEDRHKKQDTAKKLNVIP
ncbi:hypothetical protein JRQ81_012070 [Phrynocephalus forsythii]|uniref:Uncharacterized protein n=1 Tax=Phrynocephalus forsythii TaxID=171643 RepID=A0A9Q1B4V2_9SAUR|nr:hypothetical protein JRQ81_012070 [Phrynocephalus forsythii]